MKRLSTPLRLLFCLAATLVSCSKKMDVVAPDPLIINPISDYTVTPDPTDGFTFKYNNLSKDYTKLEWRFGDDTLNTSVSPTHTFLTTGKYTTDLKTFSTTGNYSHKYTDIYINADDVVEVGAVKTGVPYQLQFSVKVKAKIKSILWTINDVDAAKGTVTATTDTTLSPVHTFGIGTFNNFTVQVTTDKGAVASVNKSVTTEGIASDITQSRIAWSTTNENTRWNQNEVASRLIDGNTKTKFGYYDSFPVPEIFTLQFPAPVTVKLYAIENGNDSESTRDPKEWYVEGSNDNNTWDILDHQTLTIGFADYLSSIGQRATRYYRFFYYPIANPKPYQYYRWRIASTFRNAFQIMEFRLYK